MEEQVKPKKSIWGEQYRRLVVVALAIMSVVLSKLVFTTINEVFIIGIPFMIAFIYSVYAYVSNNSDYGAVKKTVSSVIMFFTTLLIFGLSAEVVAKILDNGKPPSCNTINTQLVLNDIIKNGIEGYPATIGYKLEKIIGNEYNKDENTYYCTATIIANVDNVKDNPMLKDLIEKTKQFSQETIKFRVYLDQEDKTSFIVSLEN
ncbi:MAG: hypothetical protein WHU93_01775 [Arcobacteraceae bacterium]